MQSSKRKIAIVVGVCVLAAFILLLFRARDLTPGYVTLRTYLDDAAGLMDGTQVRLNGIPIGYLDAQRLTNSRNPNRKVEFDLKVKERYLREIPVDSVVGLASDNLLGDQYIGIRRGLSAEHVQPGTELATTQTQDITRMMALGRPLIESVVPTRVAPSERVSKRIKPGEVDPAGEVAAGAGSV